MLLLVPLWRPLTSKAMSDVFGGVTTPTVRVEFKATIVEKIMNRWVMTKKKKTRAKAILAAKDIKLD